jgi:hypothetical protein
MNKQEFRASVLDAYGVSTSEKEELLAYNQNFFDHNSLALGVKLPLEPEPHVVAWKQYVAEARVIGTFESLKQRLVQLQFPILAGISQTKAYQSAIRKGVPVDDMSEATGLVLKRPEQLQLIVHESLAGAIPVLIAANREDFVSLVQALTMRNEPQPVPDSMGACIVAGFNNWDRVRQYRKKWLDEHPADCSETSWAVEFQQLIPHKELYQDRFIILSDGPYSAVSATDMGLSEPEWRHISMKIRLEHECTHYFTRRVLASMRNNLLDELIADYRGIVAASGRYRSDWFLRFLGLEAFLDYREGSRVQNYRGQPPLSEKAFKVLKELVKAAAENLERFDAANLDELRQPDAQALMLMALTLLTLEELASPKAEFLIQTTLNELCSQFPEMYIIQLGDERQQKYSPVIRI